MVATGGIEVGVAVRTLRIRLKVGGDRHCIPAGPAKDGVIVPLGYRPDLDGMIGKGYVAILAGVEKTAALHADGDDVAGSVVVEAAGLRVEVDAEDMGR